MLFFFLQAEYKGDMIAKQLTKWACLVILSNLFFPPQILNWSFT